MLSSMPSASYKGYTAHLSCEGKELQTHDNVEICGNRVYAYVASLAGKEFCIHLDTPRGIIAQVEVYFDGKLAFAGQTVPGVPGVWKDMEVNGELRPFLFSTIDVVEEGEEDETVVGSAPLGTVWVSVWPVIKKSQKNLKDKGQGRRRRSCSSTREVDIPALNFEDIPLGPVCETSKLAGCHQISLGPARAATADEIEVSPYYTTGEDFFVSFTFENRPLNVLIAKGIASLTATVHRNARSAQSQSVGSSSSDRRKRAHPDPQSEQPERRITRRMARDLGVDSSAECSERVAKRSRKMRSRNIVASSPADRLHSAGRKPKRVRATAKRHQSKIV
ncbi:hypothetical protein BV25DRAFT_1178009 [Artomyces pyxidatus]|uniref:Uncharacterized protein n=1 Tax=Artomyces pyxidatus TaxID=48021 RepID=A0ACB8SSX9_9AGAM|nr:hypothetical protein BV25DRAFT_1178009 [Artomyces pyxidatus]